MQDGIIKGTGNSRLLKSAITEATTWEQFRAALIAGTLPIDLNGINADGWQQLATMLGKASLLSDAAATAIPGSPETVSAALYNLGIGKAGNRNLLDNWDFRNPVNDRGQTDYAANTYGINRWISVSPLHVGNGYVQVNTEGWYREFKQFIAPAVGTLLVGKTVTFSIWYKSDSEITVSLSADGNGFKNVTFPTATEWTVASISSTVPSHTSGTLAVSTFTSTNVASTQQYLAAKLEIGYLSTLEKDGLADHALEETRCAGAPVAIDGFGGITRISSGSYVGTGSTSKTILVPFLPSIVFIYQATNSGPCGYSNSVYWSNGFVIIPKSTTSFTVIYGTSNAVCTVSMSSSSVSLSSSYASTSYNTSGTTYYYLIIG